ncbi:MAG: hypothetical protein ACF788_04690, partial [Novipirellula sp. JB048]
MLGAPSRWQLVGDWIEAGEAVPERLAWTIGMNTPSTSAVSSTVSSAASAGAELRERPRMASLKKNPKLMS